MTKVIINFNVIKNILMWIISYLNKYVTSASFILANTSYAFNLLFYIYSKIINMHLSFEFLRETPRKRVLSINPGNYLSRRNTEKFHRETRRNFAQTICLPGLFRGVSPRNKNFAFAMVAEKRGICCYFFTGSVSINQFINKIKACYVLLFQSIDRPYNPSLDRSITLSIMIDYSTDQSITLSIIRPIDPSSINHSIDRLLSHRAVIQIVTNITDRYGRIAAASVASERASVTVL